jgi:hypothetical protein
MEGGGGVVCGDRGWAWEGLRREPADDPAMREISDKWSGGESNSRPHHCE